MEAEKSLYFERLEIFQNFLDFAIDISDATAGIAVPERLVRVNQLYTRLTVTSLSIIHLLPFNRYFPSEFKFWDFFSVATLTRCLIENYHMLYYIGVEHISSQELDFRYKLLVFHLNHEKYKLYKDYNADKEVLSDFEMNIPIDRENLKSHPFFDQISKTKQEKVLSGNVAMYLSNKEISSRLHFRTDEFMPLYRLFSNHAHSSPYAYFSISNERGRGIENATEIGHLTVAIDVCIKYLTAAMIDLLTLFPKCVEKVNATKLAIVQETFEKFRNSH